MRQLRTQLTALKKGQDQYYDSDDDDTLWEEFNALKITYGYDNTLSTDLASLEQDEELFRSKVSLASRKADQAMNNCNHVTEQFNKLLLETETQYKLWSEFGKRLRLLEQITGHDSGFTDINLN